MPAVKITNKPIGIPGDDTHFLVTQPELPEGYTPTGQETEEELAELKVESVREIEMDAMVALIQEKLDMDETPTTDSSKLVTSGGIKAALDEMDESVTSLNEDITNLENVINGTVGIKITSEAATSHSGLGTTFHSVNIESVEGYELGNAGYATGVSLFDCSGNSPQTKNGVTVTPLSNNIFLLNGTCTSSASSVNVGTYYFTPDDPEMVPISGEKPIIKVWTTVPIRLAARVILGSGNYEIKDTTVSTLREIATPAITRVIPDNAVGFNVSLAVEGGKTYTDDLVWIGIFHEDTEFVDIGEQPPVSFNSNLENICTLYYPSTIEYMANTKDYVDHHIPSDMVTESDLVYISPEMFGAVGDGIVDDTTALQDCLNYAVSNIDEPKNVRGYGRYKISAGIVIHGTTLDIYLNEIIYTGSDSAVAIHACYSTFKFNKIMATNGTGIVCSALETVSTQYDSYTNNVLYCGYLRAKFNALEIKVLGFTGNTYYNHFYISRSYSANGNIIYVSGQAPSETDIYGKYVTVPNGYLFYAEPGCSNDRIRLHNFPLEADVKNAVYGNAVLVGVRSNEMRNRRSADSDAGYLYDFSGIRPSTYIEQTDGIDPLTINVSSALTWEQCLNAVKDSYDAGETEGSRAWAKCGVGGTSYAEFYPCIRSGGYRICGGTGRYLPLGKVYVYYRNIAFKPEQDWYYLIDSNEFTVELTSTNNYEYITPTIFDIGAIGTTIINLDCSYCCIAINRIQVIQHEGKTAKVYDKLGNLIFDGTSLGAGLYTLTCSFVPLDSLSVTLENETVKTVDGFYVRTVYTGENEKWTVGKEILID